MPKRHKGKNPYLPPLPILICDAQPSAWQKIENEPDPLKRRERLRAYNVAVDALVKMYRDAERRGTVDRLDPDVRLICLNLKARNCGKLPTPKGGQIFDPHWRLWIHMTALDKIKAEAGQRGAVDRGLKAAANQLSVGYELVRNIYYDPDPEWKRVVAFEIVRREHEGAWKREAERLWHHLAICRWEDDGGFNWSASLMPDLT